MEKKLTVKRQGKKDVFKEQDVLSESIISVGNNPSATLELKDSQIAPEQFVIITENEQILLMNRAVGTIFNGKLLDLGSRVELADGDKIEIGKFDLFLNENTTNGANEQVGINVENEDNITIVPKQEAEKDKDFSTVLNNLKEEDSFYFQIINSENIVERILFDSESIWLGTSFAECAIKKDKTELDEIYASVKKDWSGAVIYPEESEEMILNGLPLTEPSRLKNEDQLILVDDFAEEGVEPTKITFHEPVVLLALNSILPENLPEPISIKPDDLNKTDINNLVDSESVNNEQKLAANEERTLIAKKKNRKLFGYFSILEIIIMGFGTLVTAAIIYLVLEFV